MHTAEATMQDLEITEQHATAPSQNNTYGDARAGAHEQRPQEQDMSVTATAPQGTHESPDQRQEQAGQRQQQEPLGQHQQQAMATQAYDELNFPEELVLDEDILDEFKQFAAGSGLSKDQAQTLVDLQTKHARKQLQAMEQLQASWHAELTSDAEFGGHYLDRTMEDANYVLKKYDTEGKLLDELNRYGMNGHAEFVRLLARIGRDLQPDRLVTNKGSAIGSGKSLAQKLWPEMYKQEGR